MLLKQSFSLSTLSQTAECLSKLSKMLLLKLRLRIGNVGQIFPICQLSEQLKTRSYRESWTTKITECQKAHPLELLLKRLHGHSQAVMANVCLFPCQKQKVLERWHLTLTLGLSAFFLDNDNVYHSSHSELFSAY